MRFTDIKTFPQIYYHVDVSWSYLEGSIEKYLKEHNLDMDPPFQRGYVWTTTQKIAFIEWGLRGGDSGMSIFFNHPGWMGSFKGSFVLVDGKQRINAVLGFIHNEFPVFGDNYFCNFEDKLHLSRPSFSFHVAKLQTYREVVEWYIAMNTGGAIHTKEDIERAKRQLTQKRRTT